MRSTTPRGVSGGFIDLHGERYYVIRDVDRMPPFFVSVISSADHWLFVSSNGGLTAGRVSPETALFPYVPVDKIHDNSLHTGCRTLLRAPSRGGPVLWEPFNREHDGRFDTRRNLYKSVLGDKLCFEEVNQDLGLTFRYTWTTSEEFGFVRWCELENLGDAAKSVELVDGFQNVLPAGTPAAVQASASNLVDAYKWSELDPGTGLATYSLYSGISDRAEPCESLRANVVYSLGLDAPVVLLSSLQLDRFREGGTPEQEELRRGVRAAYLACASLTLPRRGSRRWQLVADVEQTQGQVVSLIRQLRKPAEAAAAIARSVAAGSDELAQIVASADGFQAAAEEVVTAHHYANVLFNVLRGGIFEDQYRVPGEDFAAYVRHFNRVVHRRNQALLGQLPTVISLQDLGRRVTASGDPQLERLYCEYLPITFGRRHGDPSRPWNRFAIRLKGRDGGRLLSYEGNWRDIFQNWEALLVSFPEFTESVVAKFVNASTIDGYNPYRITRDGIDWEVEEPGNPWSYIGYWGDHQIVYLLKLLELSRQFHPERLSSLLHRPIFSYADVPYRIRPFEALVDDSKRTVDFDHRLAARIDERIATLGADGKLVPAGEGAVWQVNLLEKLLVPLLAKLGNLVVDGGIWLNTQRPEWNDANNALAGHGLSMVTLCHMRRYVRFLQDLLAEEKEAVELSDAVAAWLGETGAALAAARGSLDRPEPLDDQQRWKLLEGLGQAASRYRHSAYRSHAFSGKAERPMHEVMALLEHALAAIDHSIRSNRRADGTYHAYNVMEVGSGEIRVHPLYLMLEGQVAALTSGAIAPVDAAALVERLFDSDIYRADQRSFMLYPDRKLPGFLDKNRIPTGAAEGISLLRRMIETGDDRVVSCDAEGCLRFNAGFRNADDLESRLDALAGDYGDEVEVSREPLRDLYELVFRHREFTGRSGGMFGFEGLGCIYWHMVSKLLLAIQENFFDALEANAGGDVCRRLASLYYRVREGLGFNKSPEEYGAFPTDPYSHTPGHSGAQQPGMTGQVKEEVLSRLGELGLRVRNGGIRFDPRLLRAREFRPEPATFRFLDVDGVWQDSAVPAGGLAYTWCQVPITYQLVEGGTGTMAITRSDGSSEMIEGLALPAGPSGEVFRRSGQVRGIAVTFPKELLHDV